MLTWVRRAAGAAVPAVAVVGLLFLVTRSTGPDVERPIVLVSGRDDHGLLAAATVELLDSPDGSPVDAVADGTLAAVTATHAEWLEVRALEGAPAAGWIHDFHLRGTVHVVGDPPACPVPLVGEPDGSAFRELRASEQVELLDLHESEGEVWVGVRTLGEEPQVGLVPRVWLRELPLGPIPPDVDCAELRIDPGAPTHRH